MSKRRRLASLLSSGALAALFLLPGATNAAADTGTTCAGGPEVPIAPGTYSSLTIRGFCLVVVPGDVNVTGNLTVVGGGVLLAAFGGSGLHVGGNLLVESGGIAIVGCEPFAFACFNDPNANSGGTPGFQTSDTVGHNLIGDGAVMILAHHNTINGNVIQSGGGGGVNCQLLPFGPPAYTTYEDNTIKGNAVVEGLHTCWDGFFRNAVGGNVNWNNNTTWDGTPEPPGDPTLHGDEDGNEISGNTVSGNLNCFGNFPAVQFGDSAGVPNTVSGNVHGQCTAVV